MIVTFCYSFLCNYHVTIPFIVTCIYVTKCNRFIMVNDIIKDIWGLYGFGSNPFSTSPILVKGGDIPLECFVGREEQIKQLGKILGSRGGIKKSRIW